LALEVVLRFLLVPLLRGDCQLRELLVDRTPLILLCLWGVAWALVQLNVLLINKRWVCLFGVELLYGETVDSIFVGGLVYVAALDLLLELLDVVLEVVLVWEPLVTFRHHWPLHLVMAAATAMSCELKVRDVGLRLRAVLQLRLLHYQHLFFVSYPQLLVQFVPPLLGF